jgi:hypothetical protein
VNKTCTGCGQVVALECFSLNSRGTDGRESCCKNCIGKKALQRKYGKAVVALGLVDIFHKFNTKKISLAFFGVWNCPRCHLTKVQYEFYRGSGAGGLQSICANCQLGSYHSAKVLKPKVTLSQMEERVCGKCGVLKDRSQFRKKNARRPMSVCAPCADWESRNGRFGPAAKACGVGHLFSSRWSPLVSEQFFGLRLCGKCQGIKSVSDFHRRGDGINTTCIKCVRGAYPFYKMRYAKRMREYYQKNKEAFHQKSLRYKARKKEVFVGDVDASHLLALQNWNCHLCGLLMPVGEIEHLVPTSWKTPDAPHGPLHCLMAHIECNRSKGDRWSNAWVHPARLGQFEEDASNADQTEIVMYKKQAVSKQVPVSCPMLT